MTASPVLERATWRLMASMKARSASPPIRPNSSTDVTRAGRRLSVPLVRSDSTRSAKDQPGSPSCTWARPRRAPRPAPVAYRSRAPARAGARVVTYRTRTLVSRSSAATRRDKSSRASFVMIGAGIMVQATSPCPQPGTKPRRARPSTMVTRLKRSRFPRAVSINPIMATTSSIIPTDGSRRALARESRRTPSAMLLALMTFLDFYLLVTGMLSLVRVFVDRSTAWIWSLARRRPRGRAESTLAVAGEPDRRIGGIELPIPELAGDLLVALVEALAVIREFAAPHEGTVAEPDLPEPVRIGEALARRGHTIGLAALQDALGLLERRDAAAGHDRCRQAGFADGPADRRGE